MILQWLLHLNQRVHIWAMFGENGLDAVIEEFKGERERERERERESLPVQNRETDRHEVEVREIDYEFWVNVIFLHKKIIKKKNSILWHPKLYYEPLLFYQ